MTSTNALVGLLLAVAAAMQSWGWRGVVMFGMILVFLAFVLIYIALPEAGVETRVDKSFNVPREITEVQPQDVACKGSVSVRATAQGLFYKATLGRYVLSWTEALDKAVLTDGQAVDYPVADKTITACLIKRAKLVAPRE